MSAHCDDGTGVPLCWRPTVLWRLPPYLAGAASWSMLGALQPVTARPVLREHLPQPMCVMTDQLGRDLRVNLLSCPCSGGARSGKGGT